MNSCSWIKKLIVEVTYLSQWSISAIFEYTFSTICKMWPSKINTYQLKIPTKQLKANSAITFYTNQNVFYLMIMLENQWARALINSDGRGSHRRVNVPSKQRKSERVHWRWSGGGSLRCLN